MRSLMILSGRLAADPTSKLFEETDKLVSNATIFLDPTYMITRDKAAPIHISAWEDMAKELCNFKKSDMLHIVANVRPGTYKISEEKTISVIEATVRAFLNENQAQDIKRGVFESLRAIEGVCMDLFMPTTEGAVSGDDDYINL